MLFLLIKAFEIDSAFLYAQNFAYRKSYESGRCQRLLAHLTVNGQTSSTC
jgi:hypothetical protein